MKGSDKDYKKQEKLRCFKCKEVGHPVLKCPLKPTKQEVFDILKENKKSKDSNYLPVWTIGAEENSNEVMVRINDSLTSLLYWIAVLWGCL